MHGLEGWLFSHGANYAEEKDGAWVSGLDTPEAKAALEQMQTIWQGSALGASTRRRPAGNPWVSVTNNGEVAMFSYRVFAQDSISPELADVTGVMALPPVEAGGESHQFPRRIQRRHRREVVAAGAREEGR